MNGRAGENGAWPAFWLCLVPPCHHDRTAGQPNPYCAAKRASRPPTVWNEGTGHSSRARARKPDIYYRLVSASTTETRTAGTAGRPTR
jgi:hypothetical protein